jgi:hypothetical protein
VDRRRDAWNRERLHCRQSRLNEVIAHEVHGARDLSAGLQEGGLRTLSGSGKDVAGWFALHR